MINLYDVVEYDTNIKGYWQDDSKKVYIDNINIIDINKVYKFIQLKSDLFEYKNQKAVFYIKNGIAYVEDNKGNIKVLKHNIQYKEKSISKAYIKTLLDQHSGITIFKNKDYYIIDIWK